MFLSLILSLISLIVAHLVLQSQWLHRQAQQFYAHSKAVLQAEKDLRALEQKRIKQGEYDDFIPDHLGFGCKTGAWVYKNEVFPLHSTVLSPAP